MCRLTLNLYIIPRGSWTPQNTYLNSSMRATNLKSECFFHLGVDTGSCEKSNDFLFFLDLNIYRLVLKSISRMLKIPTSKYNFKWIISCTILLKGKLVICINSFNNVHRFWHSHSSFRNLSQGNIQTCRQRSASEEVCHSIIYNNKNLETT